MHKSSSITEYSTLVNMTDLNEKYYRLSQVDFDGTKEVLKTAYIGSYKNSEIVIFPNPSKGEINIASNVPFRRVSIYNSFGQQIKVYEQKEFELNRKITIDLPGVYTLLIENRDGNIQNEKIVVN